MKDEEEDEESLDSEHFLTGEEGSSSSSFGNKGPDGDDSGNDPDSDETWINWYCRQRGNEMLVPIDQQFIYDDSNLNGLKSWERNQYDLDSFENDVYTDPANDAQYAKAIQDHKAAL